MRPLGLNLSKMKKVAEDRHSTTFEHPSGHQIVIAHSKLPFAQRKAMQMMPLHKYAEGGEAQAEPDSNAAQAVLQHGQIQPKLAPPKLVAMLSAQNNDHVGGTIRDGSRDEQFVIGNMIFNVESAKKICKGMSNGTALCSNDWSEKINVEEDHAIKADTENPVLIAMIPMEQDIIPLLFDGHHRMYRAMSEGKKELPAYIFTPEQSLAVMSAPPDLMYKLRANLKDHGRPQKLAKGGPVRKMADGGLSDPTQFNQMTPEQIQQIMAPEASKDQGDQPFGSWENQQFGTGAPMQPQPESNDIQFQAPEERAPADVTPVVQAAIPDTSNMPAAPIPQQAPMGQTQIGTLPGAIQQEIKGYQEQQKVQEQQSAMNQAQAQADIQQRQALMDESRQNLQDYQAHSQQFINDFAQGKINPNAYLENLSVAGKISTAIGLLLGGAASGTLGRNPASDFLNQQMERNIQAQIRDQDKRQTLVGMNRQLYNDQMLAENQTRINMNDMLAHQTQLNAYKLGTPAAQSAADIEIGKLKAANIPLLQQNAIRTTVLNNLARSGGRGTTAMDLTYAIPGFSQQDAEKEQGAVNSAKAKVDQANRLFDQLEKEQTPINALNPQSYARVHQIAAQMVPLVQDEDPSKRLTEQSYEAEIAPFIFNTMATKDTQRAGRQGVLNLIKTAMQGKAPHMEQYAPAELPNYTVPQAAETQTRGGIPYVKVPGGWKKAG